MSCWLLLVGPSPCQTCSSSLRPALIPGAPEFELPLLSAAARVTVYAGACSAPLPTAAPGAHLVPGVGPPSGAGAGCPEHLLILDARRRPSPKFSGPRRRSSLFHRLLRREQSSVMQDGVSLALLRHRRRHAAGSRTSLSSLQRHRFVCVGIVSSFRQGLFMGEAQ
ncbi:hypothetical protein NDU88_011009 [Pleurodeles waltl]|uniref:Uncharacterized protein n=1 Tax=Pleurodeles waltl TaxID=8319 RepID=A0AAV7QYW4_PLEWA|nr:hypothetical protein NDU88_011009 [Pleurodeles waltl]